jgi:hypothetical protein
VVEQVTRRDARVEGRNGVHGQYLQMLFGGV